MPSRRVVFVLTKGGGTKSVTWSHIGEVLSRFHAEHLQLTLSGCCVAAIHPLRTQKLRTGGRDGLDDGILCPVLNHRVQAS
jgi:hypothetical protein